MTEGKLWLLRQTAIKNERLECGFIVNPENTRICVSVHVKTRAKANERDDPS